MGIGVPTSIIVDDGGGGGVCAPLSLSMCVCVWCGNVEVRGQLCGPFCLLCGF